VRRRSPERLVRVGGYAVIPLRAFCISFRKPFRIMEFYPLSLSFSSTHIHTHAQSSFRLCFGEFESGGITTLGQTRLHRSPVTSGEIPSACVCDRRDLSDDKLYSPQRGALSFPIINAVRLPMLFIREPTRISVPSIAPRAPACLEHGGYLQPSGEEMQSRDALALPIIAQSH